MQVPTKTLLGTFLSCGHTSTGEYCLFGSTWIYFGGASVAIWLERHFPANMAVPARELLMNPADTYAALRIQNLHPDIFEDPADAENSSFSVVVHHNPAIPTESL